MCACDFYLFGNTLEALPLCAHAPGSASRNFTRNLTTTSRKTAAIPGACPRKVCPKFVQHGNTWKHLTILCHHTNFSHKEFTCSLETTSRKSVATPGAYPRMCACNIHMLGNTLEAPPYCAIASGSSSRKIHMKSGNDV